VEAVIARSGRQRIGPSRATPFEALARAVVHQGVSGAAAAVASARLRGAAAGALTPAGILAAPRASLTAAGLSGAKADVIRNLAGWFAANRRIAETLPALRDDEVIHALTGITGIGVWTANVFLIFDLGRPDVTPASDLGIRRGVQLTYALEHLATPRQVREKAERWRPYRSMASVYLWNAVRLKIRPGDLETRRLA